MPKEHEVKEDFNMPIEAGYYFGNNNKSKSSFEKCVAEGGTVRKLFSEIGKYVNICYPKDGSRSVPENELANKKRVWRKK